MALLQHHRPLWALVAAAPVIAAISTAAYAQTWKINLRDADLTAFINEVADITGKNFAVDPRVRGNVTVILMCAELAGDFHLGDSRQLTDKSLLPFDLVS